MMLDKKRQGIYVLRPYYIDAERLFDLYSTVMNGYTETAEVIEKSSNSEQKNKKTNGQIGFTCSPSIKAIISHDSKDFATRSSEGTLSSDLTGNHSFEKNRTFMQSSESQVVVKYQLSPCVLLNWMIAQMYDDDLLIKLKKRILRREVAFSNASVGSPIILDGYIIPNKIKEIQKISFEKETDFFKALLSKIKSRPSKNKSKYVFVSLINESISKIQQQLDIEIGVLCESYENLYDAYSQNKGWTDYNHEICEYIERIIDIIHGTAFDISYRGYSELRRLYDLVSIPKRGRHDEQQEESNDAGHVDSYEEHDFHKNCNNYIHKLDEFVDNLKEYIRNVTGRMDDRVRKYYYLSHLKESGFYDADIQDILQPIKVQCLGLIRSIGIDVCEIEVVAIYQ